jgi:hypothetical protein
MNPDAVPIAANIKSSYPINITKKAAIVNNLHAKDTIRNSKFKNESKRTGLLSKSFNGMVG